MKVRITDLMDLYYGAPIELTPRDKQASPEQAPAGKPRKAPWPLIAASVLLIAAATALAVFPRVSGGAPKDTTALEQPDAVVSEASASEEAETAAAQIDPITMTGAFESCYGNLFTVDDVFYTMTESGPEAVETTHVETTVELYGTWEINLDYAVIDGELCFRDNVSEEPYTVIDGEKISRSDYYETYPSSDDVEWQYPSVATAGQLGSSADTVMMHITRDDTEEALFYDNYAFLYNVVTGEVSDPLAKVPTLFDYGVFCGYLFNDTGTRVIVNVYPDETTDDGIFLDSVVSYVCDLTTGEMLPVTEIAAQCYPEAGEGAIITCADYTRCGWADNDMLTFWLLEQDADGTESYWACSYDMASGTLNYQVQIPNSGTLNDSDRYILLYVYASDGSGDYQDVGCLDTITGQVYYFKDNTLYPCGQTVYVFGEAGNSVLVCGVEGNTAYFIDFNQMAWADVTEYLPETEENIAYSELTLLYNNWICVGINETIYFCPIPTGLTMYALETSTGETVTESAEEPSAAEDSITMTGTFESCYGNLFTVDDVFYTMTESGPEAVEATHVETTVELYGTWEIDLDYAVIDGELCFRNNTSRAVDALTEGEGSGDGAETQEAAVATASRWGNSADTVLMAINRTDVGTFSGYNYVFLYNVLTGEVTDPLANVPELFDHGICTDFILNSAGTRAVVEYFTDVKDEDCIRYYVCDLNTGELTAIGDIAAEYFPETQERDTISGSDYSNFRWTDNDTLAFSLSMTDHFWACSCNLSTGGVNYQTRISGHTFAGGDERYVSISCDGDSENDLGQYGFWDTANGQTCYFDNVSFGSYYCQQNDRYGLIWGSETALYLVDFDQMAWADLTGEISAADDTNQAITLVGDGWLCVYGEGDSASARFYRIPTARSMTPLAAGT